MGLIFDINSAKLFQSWYQSSQGKAMEESINGSILALLKPQRGERILDLGCGEGNHLLFLNSLGLDISGIDASPYMISRARERLGNRCTLKTAMAEDLPFDDNEFDLAVFINTLEFVDDPLKALKEAGRVAKRKVFVGVMNSLSWNCLYRKSMGFFRESIFRYVRFYNIWDLKSYFKTAYGNAPLTWHCIPGRSSMFGRREKPLMERWDIKHCPFGSFIGVSATILYRFRTEQHPLKVRLKKAEQSVIRGASMKNLNRVAGRHSHERSVSL
jgi:SAM-dependent methyltransferase